MIEFSLNFLPVKPKRVVTAVDDAPLDGSEFAGKIVGVSVIRAGEAMETALRSCCRNVRIGKILIQRDEHTANPVFYMAKFPSDIHERHVLLLDPMLATGGSALCAIGKLVDAGVDEDKIVFVNVVSTPEGISRVLDMYPSLHICTGSVAEGLTAHSYIKRSIGDFGDRYFAE
jgi:uracil phosphoribosyltransferase